MHRHRFTHIMAPALALGLLFFSCTRQENERSPAAAAPPLPDSTVVATVNGDPITLGDFQERFSRAGLNQEGSSDPAVRQEFLNRLVERKMMLREAQRRRIKVGLQEINQRIEVYQKEHGKNVREDLAAQGIDFEKWKSDIWENMMIERLVSRDVDRSIRVSPAEVRKFFQENQDSFSRRAQVRVRQIVLSTDAEAQSALEQLRAGADFASLAREKSTAPEASKGGDLGYFSEGEMPSEFNVVFGLSKGGTSGVVKSPYGFHIFKLEDRRPAGKRSLDEVSEEITKKLLQEKQDDRFQRWLKELRGRTKFEINYQALGQ